MELFEDFADLLAAFDEHKVRYLLIGGYAVSLHARPRFTKDIDLWVDSNHDNKRRCCAALTEFGAPESVVDAFGSANASDVVWFGNPPFRVDLLQSVGGMSFETAWQARVQFMIAGCAVPVIGIDHLVELKRVAGRPRDLDDIEALKRSQFDNDAGID